MSPVHALVRSVTLGPAAALTVALFPLGEALEAAVRGSGHRAVGPAVPPDAVVSAVVCPHRLEALRAADRLSRALHAPLVCVWEDPPEPGWGPGRLAHARSCRGTVDVFPTAALAAAWGVADGVVAPDWGPFLRAVAARPFLWTPRVP